MPKKKQPTVPELLAQLGEAKNQKTEAYKYYASLAAREGELKQAVQETLLALGLKSAKSVDGRFTASIANRPGISIKDEKAAIAWLKEENLDLDYYTGLKAAPFKQLAELKLQETGEIVPGTEQTTSEYLTFRENKPKEKEAKNAKEVKTA